MLWPAFPVIDERQAVRSSGETPTQFSPGPDARLYHAAMAAGTRTDGSAGGTGWPVLLLALLAILAWLTSEPLAGIESRYYDALQRIQAAPGSEQIVLIDLDGQQGGWWNDPALPALASALAASRPLAVLPASPAPPAAQLPDLDRLATLVELEQRSRRDAATDTSGDQQDPVAAQLARIQTMIRAQDEALATLAAGSRLILTVGTEATRSDLVRTSGTGCDQALLLLGAALPAGATARTTSAALPRPAVCARSWQLGGAATSPEADGVVRRLTLLQPIDGGLLPAAALAGAAAVHAENPGGRAAALQGLLPDGWQDPEPAAAYHRFYRAAGNTPAFRSMKASDLLASPAGQTDLSGQLVILGQLGNAAATFNTPVDAAMPAATLLATGLSNLLLADYVLRPAWLRWIELGLLLALALWAGLLCWRLPPWYAALLAGSLLPALLALEAWLLMAGQVWIQLATPALFAPLACLLMLGLARTMRPASATAATPVAAAPAAGSNEQDVQELDLAFSVLRQQAASDATKKRLYNIAMEHGRRRDFARAERVLTHLASLDPDYKDVIYKLSKLSGARADEPASGKPNTPRAAESPQADRLGRYQLEGIIGRGAMATVYLGRDPMINRRVAIKTIPLAEEFSEADLANARSQFIREAESAGRLNHPNIIAIYDAGEDHKMAYLAMEYFDGKPLSHYAQPDRLLPVEVVLELGARAAEALHYAHTQKVVHRDIKPANLLYHKASDTLKLTDFGIARLTDNSRTRSGIILGTPSYMSPEQLSASSVTGQSDIYSLGVTMYHLLTGSPPFQADSIPKLMEKIVHKQHRPVSEFRDDVPSCVDMILNEAMAKQPPDRFPHGRAMALALRDCCSRMTNDATGSKTA